MSVVSQCGFETRDDTTHERRWRCITKPGTNGTFELKIVGVLYQSGLNETSELGASQQIQGHTTE